MASASPTDDDNKMSITSSGSNVTSNAGGGGGGGCIVGGVNLKIDEDFLNSGRAGRRNAIPDIYLVPSRPLTSELPADFARLSCNGQFLKSFYKTNQGCNHIDLFCFI